MMSVFLLSMALLFNGDTSVGSIFDILSCRRLRLDITDHVVLDQHVGQDHFACHRTDGDMVTAAEQEVDGRHIVQTLVVQGFPADLDRYELMVLGDDPDAAEALEARFSELGEEFPLKI